MSNELASKYQPKDVEAEVNQRWNEAKAFAADPNNDGSPYCIVIPPPNVTAALHMGHALNNTLQDILIRYHRMLGDNTLWMPGTDHAGIATQTVVDKRLQAEGQPALKEYKQQEAAGNGGREQFIEKVQAWKDEYEQRITEQLKAMGCSCDWDRQRFTMDDICARAVREAFFRLFKDGLIYRGKRLVNWDPVSQTALADDEVEMEEVDGHFWYMKYPVVDDAGNDIGDFVTVATTRPETMLGDTAVAVNPNDPPRAKYIGKHVRLPIVNRIIPVLGDDYVVIPDPESSDEKAKYASGFLKVTPAHDPNDYEIGQRHNLEKINVMAPDASISKDHGWPEKDVANADPFLNELLGKDRYIARKMLIKWFDEQGLLEEVRPYRHSVGHSYRSHVPVEPYLSDQWYVKVTDDRLAGAALNAIAKDQRSESEGRVWKEGNSFGTDDGQLRFYPARYAKTFQTWHENIRDWCISRQLWWGHRIPVWNTELESNSAADEITALESPTVTVRINDGIAYVCVLDQDDQLIEQLESRGFTQDPDVLDTWFSSGLWPISTMGWPEDTTELNTWNPGNVLCTAREIITLWVSRMVMFNSYLRDGKLPFTDVFIHAMIQDGHGQKMSKSLGNGVDPLDIIHSHGSDAMRFTLASMTTQTQDVRMPVDMVCPHSGQMFTPKFITGAGGHKVAAPIQDSPAAKGKQMVSSYGMASGKSAPTDDMPLARNTSEKFDLGRNFANKLWNAVRFALGYLNETGSDPVSLSDLSLPDRWILSRLAKTISNTTKALKAYEFKPYADGLYDFIWRDFCDWYIEAIKPTVKDNVAQQRVLSTCIDTLLRLLHPTMPFITEKLWERLNDVAANRGISGLELPASELLILAKWPTADESLSDPKAETEFELMREIVSAMRQVRTANKVPPRQQVVASIRADTNKLSTVQTLIESLAVLSDLTVAENLDRPNDAASVMVGDIEIFLHDLADTEAEKDRLAKRAAELKKSVGALNGRLSNKGYTDKAPAHLVQQTRDQLAEAERELASVEQQLTAL